MRVALLVAARNRGVYAAKHVDDVLWHCPCCGDEKNRSVGPIAHTTLAMMTRRGLLEQHGERQPIWTATPAGLDALRAEVST